MGTAGVQFDLDQVEVFKRSSGDQPRTQRHGRPENPAMNVDPNPFAETKRHDTLGDLEKPLYEGIQRRSP